MKILMYLIVAVAIGMAIAWFGFGIHPQSLWQRIPAFSDMADTAGKFGKTAGNRFDEARDVYNGKIEADDPFAYPNAR